MRKNFLLLLILPFILFGCSNTGDYVKINNTKINLIGIADNNETAYMGLSFKESICDNCGMLFPFENKQNRTFVMRDMMFPLDIIWIDENKIVKIDKNLPPEGHDFKNLYSSNQPVDNVLEVNAGLTDKKNIKVGDILDYNMGKYETDK